MDIMNFIPEHLMVLVVATYVLGVFLKKIEGFRDKYITIALMAFCITLAFLLNIINAQCKTMLDTAVNALLQGILCWGVSVGVNQTFKQLKKKDE